MKYQLFNGVFYPAEENLIHASNRAFNFGDGFFESIRVSNGKAPFIHQHWKRLTHACEILQISVPAAFTVNAFRNSVLSLAQKNDEPNSRVRFQGFRAGAGKYTPERSELSWSATSIPMETREYRLNRSGLKIGICNTCCINPAPQSVFKSTNALPYVLASIEKEKQKWDDCLIKDAHGFLAEATVSNFFLVRGNELLTPDLSNGGVAGVLRDVILEIAPEIGLIPKMGLLKLDDVFEADECFLTNATKGIQWVVALQQKRFFRKKSEKLLDLINRKYGLIN